MSENFFRRKNLQSVEVSFQSVNHPIFPIVERTPTRKSCAFPALKKLTTSYF